MMTTPSPTEAMMRTPHLNAFTQAKKTAVIAAVFSFTRPVSPMALRRITPLPMIPFRDCRQYLLRRLAQPPLHAWRA